MRTFEAAIAVVAGVAWFAFYMGLKKVITPSRSPEWCSRIVAGAHAITIICLATSAVLSGPHPIEEAGADNLFEHDLAIGVSLGYFIYDMGWVLLYTPTDKVMLAHHIISIGGFTTVLLSGQSGSEISLALVVMELTNPLLQLRWFIRDAGYKDTLIFKIVDITFIFLFFTCRVLYGTYFIIRVCTHPGPTLVVKTLAVSFYCVSWAFMITILSYMQRKYLMPAPPAAAANATDEAI